MAAFDRSGEMRSLTIIGILFSVDISVLVHSFVDRIYTLESNLKIKEKRLMFNKNIVLKKRMSL
jgi:hypothetical protein